MIVILSVLVSTISQEKKKKEWRFGKEILFAKDRLCSKIPKECPDTLVE